MSQFELRFLESIFCGVNFLNQFCCENMEMELRLEKKCTEELDDALMRSIYGHGHGRMVEHYVDLQQNHTSYMNVLYITWFRILLTFINLCFPL
ncbi:putative kinesin-like protein [Helianthus anomalus]